MPGKVPNDKPSIAVVIGSSGAGAFAALPMLQALDAANIEAELVIATGGGALIASLWSAGYDMKQIENIFNRYFTREAYHDISTSSLCESINDRITQGTVHSSQLLYHPNSLSKAYDLIFKDALLEELNIKTLLYATDLQKASGYCIENGSIAQAVAACGSFFPVYEPVLMHDKILADGSFISPLPVYEAVTRGFDIIIAVFLEDSVSSNFQNFLESFLLLHTITTRSLRQAQLFTAIDMHHYEICIAEIPFMHPVLPWDLEHIPAILSQGRLIAQDKIIEIQSMIKNFTIKKNKHSHNSNNFTYHSR